MASFTLMRLLFTTNFDYINSFFLELITFSRTNRFSQLIKFLRYILDSPCSFIYFFFSYTNSEFENHKRPNPSQTISFQPVLLFVCKRVFRIFILSFFSFRFNLFFIQIIFLSSDCSKVNRVYNI